MGKQSAGSGSERQRGDLAEMRELLKEFRTVMLVTTTPEGLLRGRPMAMQDLDEVTDADLWFVTDDDTAKVDEITYEQQVCVVCYRGKDGAYVSISARARFDKDRGEIERLWKPDWSVWFAGGKDDPRITLLKLEVHRAEYWEPAGGKLRVLFDMATSAVKGERADAKLTPVKEI